MFALVNHIPALEVQQSPKLCTDTVHFRAVREVRTPGTVHFKMILACVFGQYFTLYSYGFITPPGPQCVEGITIVDDARGWTDPRRQMPNIF